MSVLVFAALGYSTMAVSSCATTGQAFWSNPQVQQELAFLEAIGTDALNAWIQSMIKLHGPRPRAAGSTSAPLDGVTAQDAEPAIQAAIAKAQLRCPNVPKDKIETVIRAKFAVKLNKS